MTAQAIKLQPVAITASRVARDNDNELTLRISGLDFRGWTDVRVTRGIERCPSDFEVQLTERYPDNPQIMQIRPGQSVEVLLGDDLVITGYVDRVTAEIEARRHRISIAGRGKCQDLESSAIAPNCVIEKSTVLEIARLVAQPYGIEVDVIEGQDAGELIPPIIFSLGDTAFAVIENACRYRALLAYEMPDGSLQLARTSTRRAASGFAEGVNVIRARAVFAQDARYSEYVAYLVAVDAYGDQGEGGNLLATVTDAEVTRFRRMYVPAEGPPGTDPKDWTLRATWERNRRFGRGYVVQVTTDGWRDVKGRLYEPNTMVRVNLPSLKLNDVDWLIADVTYHRGAEGTTCDLVIMPPEAFSTQPPVWPKYQDIQGPAVRP